MFHSILGYLVIAMAIAIIGALVVLHVRSSGVLKDVKLPDNLFSKKEEPEEEPVQDKEHRRGGGRRIAPGKNKKVRLANAPKIRVESRAVVNPDSIQGEYAYIEMQYTPFTLGADPKSDLQFSDDSVENEHAVIYKRNKQGETYYELVNKAKQNPVEYLNSDNRWYPLGPNHGYKLSAHEFFRMGEVRMAIDTPETNGRPAGPGTLIIAGKKKPENGGTRKAEMPPKRSARKGKKTEKGATESDRIFNGGDISL